MRLLDLFCGAGGAAEGYHRAGFDEIVGVDIVPQPNYPFTFVQGDALEPPVRLEDFDLVHASPPCQSYSAMSNRWGSDHPELITEVRSRLEGHPFVIENVQEAGRDMACPVRLHGGMFGLDVHRPRLFDCSWLVMTFPADRTRDAVAVYGKPDGRRLYNRADGSELRAWSSAEQGQRAMGIDWMTVDELREAIPPAYTEFIGEQFIAQAARV